MVEQKKKLKTSANSGNRCTTPQKIYSEASELK